MSHHCGLIITQPNPPADPSENAQPSEGMTLSQQASAPKDLKELARTMELKIARMQGHDHEKACSRKLFKIFPGLAASNQTCGSPCSRPPRTQHV